MITLVIHPLMRAGCVELTVSIITSPITIQYIQLQHHNNRTKSAHYLSLAVLGDYMLLVHADYKAR